MLSVNFHLNSTTIGLLIDQDKALYSRLNSIVKGIISVILSDFSRHINCDDIV